MSEGSRALSRDGNLFVFIEGVGPAGPAVRHRPRQSASGAAASPSFGEPLPKVGLSPSGRFLLASYFVDFEYGSQVTPSLSH